MPKLYGRSMLVGTYGKGLDVSSPASSASASSETRFAGAAASAAGSGGAVAWTDPGNATADDGAAASASEGLSEYLKATAFGFSVPAGAAVTGVTLAVERHSDLGNSADLSVKLVKGGAVSGSEKSTGAGWPDSPAVAAYGGPSDLWGLALTPADVNAAGFGAAVAASVGALDTAFVDYIKLTIHYTV